MNFNEELQKLRKEKKQVLIKYGELSKTKY